MPRPKTGVKSAGDVIYPVKSICRIVRGERRDGSLQFTIWYEDDGEWVEMGVAPATTLNDAYWTVRNFMIGYKQGLQFGKKKARRAKK